MLYSVSYNYIARKESVTEIKNLLVWIEHFICNVVIVVVNLTINLVVPNY